MNCIEGKPGVCCKGCFMRRSEKINCEGKAIDRIISGQITSDAKKTASRSNGRLGGRKRKGRVKL